MINKSTITFSYSSTPLIIDQPFFCISYQKIVALIIILQLIHCQINFSQSKAKTNIFGKTQYIFTNIVKIVVLSLSKFISFIQFRNINTERNTMIKNHLSHEQQLSSLHQSAIFCQKPKENSGDELGKKKKQEPSNNQSSDKNEGELDKQRENKQNNQKPQSIQSIHKRGKVKVFGSKNSISSYVVSINKAQNQCYFIQPQLNNRSVSENKNSQLINRAHKQQKTVNKSSLHEFLYENASNISNTKSEKHKKKLFGSRRAISPTIIMINSPSALSSKKHEPKEHHKTQYNANQLKKQVRFQNMKRLHEKQRLIGSQKKLNAKTYSIQFADQIQQFQKQISYKNQQISEQQQLQQSEYVAAQSNKSKQLQQNAPIIQPQLIKINKYLPNSNKNLQQNNQPQPTNNCQIKVFDLFSSHFSKIARILSDEQQPSQSHSINSSQNYSTLNNYQHNCQSSDHSNSSNTISYGKKSYNQINALQQEDITLQGQCMDKIEINRSQKRTQTIHNPTQEKYGQFTNNIKVEDQNEVLVAQLQKQTDNQINPISAVSSSEKVHQIDEIKSKKQLCIENDNEQKSIVPINAIQSTLKEADDIKLTDRNSYKTFEKCKIQSNQQFVLIQQVNQFTFTNQVKLSNKRQSKVDVLGCESGSIYEEFGDSYKYQTLQTQLKKSSSGVIDFGNDNSQKTCMTSSNKKVQQHQNKIITSSNNSIDVFIPKPKPKQISDQTLQNNLQECQKPLNQQQQQYQIADTIKQEKLIPPQPMNQQKRQQHDGELQFSKKNIITLQHNIITNTNQHITNTNSEMGCTKSNPFQNRTSQEQSELNYFVNQTISKFVSKARAQSRRQVEERLSQDKMPQIPKSQNDESQTQNLKQSMTSQIQSECPKERKLKKAKLSSNELYHNTQRYKQQTGIQVDLRALKKNINKNSKASNNKQATQQLTKVPPIILFQTQRRQLNQLKQMRQFAKSHSKEMQSDSELQSSACSNMELQRNSMNRIFKVYPQYAMSNNSGSKRSTARSSCGVKIQAVAQSTRNKQSELQQHFGKQHCNQRNQRKSTMKKQMKFYKQTVESKRQKNVKNQQNNHQQLSSFYEKAKCWPTMVELQAQNKSDKENAVQGLSKRYPSEIKSKKHNTGKKHSPYLSSIFIVCQNTTKSIHDEDKVCKSPKKLKYPQVSWQQSNINSHNILMKEHSDNKNNDLLKTRFIHLRQPTNQKQYESHKTFNTNRLYEQRNSNLQYNHRNSHSYLRAHAHQFSYLYPPAQLGQTKEKLNQQLKQLDKKLKRSTISKGKVKNEVPVHFYYHGGDKQIESYRSYNIQQI